MGVYHTSLLAVGRDQQQPSLAFLTLSLLHTNLLTHTLTFSHTHTHSQTHTYTHTHSFTPSLLHSLTSSDSWDDPGLRSGVHIDGVLNDVNVVDKYWSVEIAFPLSAMAYNTTATLPPKPGQYWRINFSRVEWHVFKNGTHFSKVTHTHTHSYIHTHSFTHSLTLTHIQLTHITTHTHSHSTHSHTHTHTPHSHTHSTHSRTNTIPPPHTHIHIQLTAC